MARHLTATSLLCAASLVQVLAAQSVLPPFDTTYQIVNLGTIPGTGSYGGTAFLPTNPNVLMVSIYPTTDIRAVPLVRNTQGFIIGTGAATPVITVGGTDGGLAYGPNNVLFATWYGPNRLSQIEFGSTSTDRVDDLTPIGISSASVGACTFVPPGLPGAGRLKICTWSSSAFHDVPLTPDGNGTFALGTAGAPVTLAGGVEGIVYAPAGAPLFGGQLLACEWSPGNIATYQVDAIGNPLPATRQVVVGGAYGLGGGAVDPITGELLFLGGQGELLILRNGAACGTFTSYGPASPGALGTPTLGASGCSRIGQTISLLPAGVPNGIGILALGNFQTNVMFNNLTVLQSLNVTVLSILNAQGQGPLSLTIPINPALGNSHVYLQAAYLDNSTTSGLIASAGLDILIR
jgi:hypothetical protein